MRTIIVMMMIMKIIVMMIMVINIMMIMPFVKLTMSSKSGAASSKNASKIDLMAELRGTVAAV